MRYLKSWTFVVGLVLTLVAAVAIAMTLNVHIESSSSLDELGGGFQDSSVGFHVSTVPLVAGATGLVLMAVAVAQTRKASKRQRA